MKTIDSCLVSNNQSTIPLQALAVRQLQAHIFRRWREKGKSDAMCEVSPMAALALIFLHLAGDIETNPGPERSTLTSDASQILSNNKHNQTDDTLYFCGTCSRQVSWDDEGVLCDSCNVWYHIECQEIRTSQYALLDNTSVTWTCTACNTTHFSTIYPPEYSDCSLYANTDSTSSADISIDSLTDERETKPIQTSSPTKFKPKKASHRPLRIINVNCQSISGKKGAWCNLLHTTKPDIIIATETWLDKSIQNAEIECDNFNVYRKDRTGQIGGGVLIAVNSNIDSCEVSTKSSAEILWVKIHCKGHRDIFVAACYRPNVADKTFTNALRETFDQIGSKRKRPCGYIVAGDFNFPGWDWNLGSLKPGTQQILLHSEFKDFLNDFGLTQMVTEPTRRNNTLDLIATNLPDQVNRTKVIPGISDHEIPFIDFAVKPSMKKQLPRKVWLFKKADWIGMRDYLTPRLHILNQAYSPCPDELWNNIKSLLLETMEIFIPRRQTKKKDSAPWIDKETKHLTDIRDRLYRKSRKKGSAKTESRFLLYKQIVKKRIRKQHAAYIHNLFTDESKSKEDLNKQFWTYVKHRRSQAMTQIGPLKKGVSLVTAAEEMAEMLNNQFVSVFSKRTPKIDYEVPTLASKMKNITISKAGVLKQLKSLKTNKACGPDGIHPRVLKELAPTLAETFTNLFQTSLDKGTVPKDWRTALVCPAFKKGEKYLPENYRPISLTSIASKMMEHIITSHLMNFAESNKLLFKNQHGFRKHRSCEKQLIEFVSDIANQLDQGLQTDACVLDFSKAFDKVNHQKLLSKLATLGVSFQVISWIDNFLTDRSQRVVVDGVMSNEAHVTSGVPQGSVLGPALFLFYINDLPDALRSTVRLFADDTILYNSADNNKLLQDDLARLELWESKWDMEFHPKKCQHISFSRKRHPAHNAYSLHNIEIPKAEHVKYLGVTLDQKLTWKNHAESIINKSNSALGFIRRNVITTSTQVKSTAYKQLVRPVLEYASGAWDSLTKTQEKNIEAVQRRAARLIFNISRTDHTTSTTKLLQDLELDELATRRQHARLKIFKQYHFSEEETISNYLSKACVASKRKHPHQYMIPHSSTQHHQRTFFIKTAKEWNQLPANSEYLNPPDVT